MIRAITGKVRSWGAPYASGAKARGGVPVYFTFFGGIIHIVYVLPVVGKRELGVLFVMLCSSSIP